MTIVEPTSGTTPWSQAALYAVVNGTGGTEITDQINSRICPSVGNNIRTTDSSPFTTTLVRIMSTRVPIRAGRSYQIIAAGEVVVNAAGAATVQNEIRYTTNDTEPTTSSTQAGRGLVVLDPGGIPTLTTFVAIVNSSTNGFLRPVVCSVRVSGSVPCIWTAGSGRPMTLYVYDIGPTNSASGTVY